MLLCVPEFLTLEGPHRIRNIRADWDKLASKIDVEREIRLLKRYKNGAQGKGLIVSFAD
jgi:hypothetical protein